jgi:predicted ABC-type ATPase
MSKNVSRLRMVAGPNGSGKSTIKSELSPELLGVYINPDDIEKDILERNFLDFTKYDVRATEQEVMDFFIHSSLLEKVDLLSEVQSLRFIDDKLIFYEVTVNAYFASVVADFIRNKLFAAGKSFTFETVMSFPDKVELLRKAQVEGYRTYLYYIATESPDINISRVRYRIKMGGHPVPEDKIINRYRRSLDLLMQAVQFTHRAYIFDNSNDKYIWVAEITDGRALEMKVDQMPAWFKGALWDKFSTAVNDSSV